MTQRSCDRYLRRGPPFIEVDGQWFLNVGFELPEDGAADADDPSKDLLVLRPLTDDEAQMLRERRFDADLEVWARVTA